MTSNEELNFRLAVLDRAINFSLKSGNDPIITAEDFYGWLTCEDPSNYIEEPDLDESNIDSAIFLN